jgi:hypothetical protein
MLVAIAREILRRPASLAGLSVTAIILGIAILFLARLPPPVEPESPGTPRTEEPTLRETPELVASPALVSPS